MLNLSLHTDDFVKRGTMPRPHVQVDLGGSVLEMWLHSQIITSLLGLHAQLWILQTYM